jgi:hypothetical protein
MLCQLKDWQRIATRYDKLAANFTGLSPSPYRHLVTMTESAS